MPKFAPSMAIRSPDVVLLCTLHRQHKHAVQMMSSQPQAGGALRADRSS